MLLIPMIQTPAALPECCGSLSCDPLVRLCRAAPYRRFVIFVICVASQPANAWDQPNTLPNIIRR
jgi:hypothetical protein